MLALLNQHAFGGPPPQGLLDGLLQLFVGPYSSRSAQIVAKQRVERLGQLAPYVVLVVNQQPLEEREIELPPERSGSLTVGRLAIPPRIKSRVTLAHEIEHPAAIRCTPPAIAQVRGRASRTHL